ncbi:hypothetical protein HYE67_000313 [Fusarium culmorum]|uniref:Uncharacterized protein n=1 Tax=Fusarium culmorum TaxID=5516 RepID=A0A2T4GQ23_FUSCU|nr:hypothetical protein FCULG_00001913 [Fusarium culmorum]QPC58082.1 hypothetical protein HYE67_000313 [Fusarium culmorum]
MTLTERASAIDRFYQIITHFNNIKPNQYDRVKLIRFTYEYSSDQLSQDNVLNAFFETQRQDPVFSGTPERLASLRGACLLRDRYRYAISRKFDKNEAIRRF